MSLQKLHDSFMCSGRSEQEKFVYILFTEVDEVVGS